MTDHRIQQRPALSNSGTAACRGKDFEHHEQPRIGEDALWPGRWTCPDCGDAGSFGDTNSKLAGLVPLLHLLQREMLDRDAVFMVPSIATPGLLGTFYGRPLYRVQGIPGPMVALSDWAARQAAVPHFGLADYQPEPKP